MANVTREGRIFLASARRLLRATSRRHHVDPKVIHKGGKTVKYGLHLETRKEKSKD
jgi:hypothetical protein